MGDDAPIKSPPKSPEKLVPAKNSERWLMPESADIKFDREYWSVDTCPLAHECKAKNFKNSNAGLQNC